MAEAVVPMVINQGEDWTSEVVWTDNYDEPIPVVHPCRMDIKGLDGQTVYQLETNPDLPEGEIPSIGLSTNVGLIQLHIPYTVTQGLNPGEYHYDLFATVDYGTTFPGPQRERLLYGSVTVNKRVTQM